MAKRETAASAVAGESVVLGYARVSTASQSENGQIEALEKAGVDEVFNERLSGATNIHSPVFRALFDRVRELRAQGVGVTVVVTKLDRFSRNASDLISSVRELGDMGASFRTLDGRFIYDSDSPFSKLVLAMFSGIAEFERDLINERTSEGRERSRERGTKFGPRPKLTEKDVDGIRQQWETGLYTPNKLAQRVGLSRSTIIRICGLYNAKPYVTVEEYDAQNRAAKKLK